MRKITFVTFMVFMVEAIVHYNQGLSAERQQKFKIPPTKKLVEIAIVVLVFASINAFIIKKT